MSLDNQIEPPQSFMAMYLTPGRDRPNAPQSVILARYELCEDMASSLVERALQVIHDNPSEAGVLQAFYAALNQPTTGLRTHEARWVVLRLAELLNWTSPPLEATAIIRP